MEIATRPGQSHCLLSSKNRLGRNKNRELIVLAEQQFDVLITMDSGMIHQQKMAGRNLIVVLLRASSNRLVDTRPLMSDVAAALENAQPGAIVSIPK